MKKLLLLLLIFTPFCMSAKKKKSHISSRAKIRHQKNIAMKDLAKLPYSYSCRNLDKRSKYYYYFGKYHGLKIAYEISSHRKPHIAKIE